MHAAHSPNLMLRERQQGTRHVYLASACWRASYTSASMRASTLSSSEPLPAATFNASARLARTACIIARLCQNKLDAVGSGVGVLASAENASRGAASTALMVSLLLGWTVANPPETGRPNHYKRTKHDTAGKKNAPNHFFDELPASTTSRTPGRRGSIAGEWLARMPMSPVAAAMFTWTTSADVKMACSCTIPNPRVTIKYGQGAGLQELAAGNAPGGGGRGTG